MVFVNTFYIHVLLACVSANLQFVHICIKVCAIKMFSLNETYVPNSHWSPVQIIHSHILLCNMFDQEYRARKKQKILERFSEQVSKSAHEAVSEQRNLDELLATMKERAQQSSRTAKGSRFTHIEKLQFAPVRIH